MAYSTIIAINLFDVLYEQKKHLFASNILRPGAWNRAELDLSPATPEELGFIQLVMATGGITFGTAAPDNPQSPETTENE